MWGKLIIVKQKFSPRWFEYFLFSKSFEFRVYFGNMLVINTWIFGPNSFSAEIAQSVERRTLDPATRVRTPVEQLFFPSFFRFLAYFCFTKPYFCHFFSLVNIFIATFLQPLCLVTEKFFFKITNALLPDLAKCL